MGDSNKISFSSLDQKIYFETAFNGFANDQVFQVVVFHKVYMAGVNVKHSYMLMAVRDQKFIRKI